MAAQTISSVTWEAEHRPETHRTLNNDHTITTDELPGTVYLYAVFDGGRVLMDMIPAGKVFEAVTKAQATAAEQQAAQQQSQQAQAQQPTTTGQPQVADTTQTQPAVQQQPPQAASPEQQQG